MDFGTELPSFYTSAPPSASGIEWPYNFCLTNFTKSGNKIANSGHSCFRPTARRAAHFGRERDGRELGGENDAAHYTFRYVKVVRPSWGMLV